MQKNKNYLKRIFLHISSSYAKILGETNFHTREIPRSGSKAKDGEKRKKEEERKLLITMSMLRIAMSPRVAHAKPPGPKSRLLCTRDFSPVWSSQGVGNEERED